MLAPLLPYNSVPDPISIVLPQARGGVAPLRHEVTLIEYIEKQRVHRQPNPQTITNTRAVVILRRLALRACLAAFPLLMQSKGATKQ
jgi:hypothetical protein